MPEIKVFLNNNSGYRLLALSSNESVRFIEGDNFEKLDDFISANKGDYVFGFLTYDLKNKIEKLKSNNPSRIDFPGFYFFVPETLVKIESDDSYSYLVGMNTKDNEETIKAFLEKKNLQESNSILLKAYYDKKTYLEKVKILKQHIQEGDIYEVTFCQEYFSDNAKINPVSTYFRLNAKTDAPFSCYFQYGEKHLISASPERFVKRDGNKLISQPIKGTARRSTDPSEDLQIKKGLFENEKERSENVMIVDLVRNDLSKIAEKNSVTVEELFGVYTFNTVHQLISTVSANLKKEVSFSEIIRALFPMGSMTGAPKIKAMELIESYESFKRGLFSGSVGYIKPSGDFDFNVIIRSILYDESRGMVSCPVGGAITIQSDPEKEYEECLLKVEALKQVLNE
jgi:para-aminobenzoate synthetase component 1